jgi:uncharacterized protein YukJ
MKAENNFYSSKDALKELEMTVGQFYYRVDKLRIKKSNSYSESQLIKIKEWKPPIKVKKARVDKIKIIEYFQNINKNSSKAIATVFNTRPHIIDNILNEYFNTGEITVESKLNYDN